MRKLYGKSGKTIKEILVKLKELEQSMNESL